MVRRMEKLGCGNLAGRAAEGWTRAGAGNFWASGHLLVLDVVVYLYCLRTLLFVPYTLYTSL